MIDPLAFATLAITVPGTGTPWYLNAGLMGGLTGTFIGLWGAALGTVGGICAPRGTHRGLVMALAWGLPLFGVVMLLAGAAVYLAGHPWMSATAYLMVGFVSLVVGGPMIPVMRAAYAAAERRRMQAGDL